MDKLDEAGVAPAGFRGTLLGAIVKSLDLACLLAGWPDGVDDRYDPLHAVVAASTLQPDGAEGDLGNFGQLNLLPSWNTANTRQE